MGTGAADTEDGSPVASDLSVHSVIHLFVCSFVWDKNERRMRATKTYNYRTEVQYKKKKNSTFTFNRSIRLTVYH